MHHRVAPPEVEVEVEVEEAIKEEGAIVAAKDANEISRERAYGPVLQRKK